MTKEKASKYLIDKARKELLAELKNISEGDFEWSGRGSVITAKHYNPKWNGANDDAGIPIYSGKEVQFKIEVI